MGHQTLLARLEREGITVHAYYAEIGALGGAAFANTRFGEGLVATAATVRRVAGLIAEGLLAAGEECEREVSGGGHQLWAGAWQPAPLMLGGVWKMFLKPPAKDKRTRLPATAARLLGLVDEAGAVVAARIT